MDRTAFDIVGRENVPAFTLAFLRTLPDPVLLLNRDGRITFLSQNGQRALEVERLNAVVGRPWWEFWPEPMAGEVEARIRSAATGATERFEEAVRESALGRRRALEPFEWKDRFDFVRDASEPEAACARRARGDIVAS